MRKWLRRGAMALVVLLGVVAGLAAVGWQLASRKMERKVDVHVRPVAAATDAKALERGKYLYLSRGCSECHGNAGGGRVFVSDGALQLAGPNITPAGVVARYTPEDWVRIIRHGVKPDGRAAMVMPSEDFNRFTDADLAALVGYIRTLSPRSGGAAIVQLPPHVRVAYGFGMIKDAAEKIDHSLPPQQPVAAGVNAEHGKYVANMCIGCHGEKLAGGKIPGGPPHWPAAANLTPGDASGMARYKDAAAFTTMLRTGKRPDGTSIQVMPFESLARIDDVDAQALFAYLKTLPPEPFGKR